MRRLNKPERKGLTKLQLLLWGLALAVLGIVSRSILQNGVLQMHQITQEQLLENLSASNNAMTVATVAIVMQAIETCAIPIFAFLLVNGFQRAKSTKKLFLCLLATALISEIPYNFANYGVAIHTLTRNPVVALVVGVVVLYFFRRLQENTFANVLVKSFVVIASILWVGMLSVEQGLPLLTVMMVMWALREKKSMGILLGGAIASACVVFSPLYILAALGILPVYFYREEEEQQELSPVLYGIYPVLLIAAGVASILM